MEEFQFEVRDWLEECLGQEVADDKRERGHRLLEEALELVQANGCSREEALQLVDYVYGRPVGVLEQEVGGVACTLAALCSAEEVSLEDCAWRELDRIRLSMDKIRAKQASKPRLSPLPGRLAK